MNVAFDPWIPVVTMNGESKLVSLNTVFTEGENLADLAVRPHERVALMRLFLCIAHAALNGPQNYDEWCEVPERLGDAASDYLEYWKDSFELFHPTKPWLQIPNICKQKNIKTSLDGPFTEWTPVSKLCFSYASGHTSTLFDHRGIQNERDISLETVLLSLLTFQCFSPGGLISQVFWGQVQSKKTSKDSPCISASMLHAFLRGGNLFVTIQLNLPIREDILRIYSEIGRPVWEMMPLSFDDTKDIKNATRTYVGRLVPLVRFILLHPTAPYMLLGDGLEYPTFTDGFPQEPTATVVVRKVNGIEARTILSYRPAKSIWRELGAIIVKQNAYENGRPMTLSNIDEKVGFDLEICALARDQATIIDAFDSVIFIPSQLNTIEGQNTYDAEVKTAEFIADRLGWAIEIYREGVDGGWEGRLKNAGAHKGALKAKLRFTGSNYYWTAVEKNISLLMNHIRAIGTDEAIPSRKVWHRMLVTTAFAAYRAVCGNETPRQIKAFVKGWQQLTSAIDNMKIKEEGISEAEDE